MTILLMVASATHVFKELDWNIINVLIVFVSGMCRVMSRCHNAKVNQNVLVIVDGSL